MGRAATTFSWNSVTVTPHVWAGSEHAFDDVTPGAALAFASTGSDFNVTGVPLAEDTALIGAGLDLAVGLHTTAGLSEAERVVPRRFEERYSLVAVD